MFCAVEESQKISANNGMTLTNANSNNVAAILLVPAARQHYLSLLLLECILRWFSILQPKPKECYRFCLHKILALFRQQNF